MFIFYNLKIDMPIHVYKKNNILFISPIVLNDNHFKKQIVYKNLEIENINYNNLPKGCEDYHILNSNLVPARMAYIIIINKDSLIVRLFEKFDVLKDYKILTSEISYVIYYINNAIKINYGKLDIRKYYNICTGCKTIHNSLIQKCVNCNNCMCSNCNILESLVCDDCDCGINLDIETDISSD